MPETRNAGPTEAARKNGDAGDPSHYGKRTPEAPPAAEQTGRATEAAGDRRAEAREAAVRANREILRTSLETAQGAMRAGVEASATALATLTTTLTKTFGVVAPDPQLADQSAQNVRAVSQAGTALAQGAQEASRAWLDLVQQSARTNVEALSQLAGCRTLQDVVAVQSHLARESLQRVLDGGETIARSTTLAMQQASLAIQTPPPGPAPGH